MGLFNFFKSSESERYVTQDAFKSSLSKQSQMTSQTMEKLRKYDIREDSVLKLEFFFYTDALNKAKKLADELSNMAYSVDYKKSASNSSEFVITGWTDPIQMGNETVLEWARLMCELGYKNDCDFDGWGTNPSQ